MQIALGEIVEGKVSGIKNYGAFIVIKENINAMVHISEISGDYVKDISDYLKIGDIVKVKIISIGDNKISASIKQANAENSEHNQKVNTQPIPKPTQSTAAVSFEDMMSRFKSVSEDRLNDLKKSTDSKQKGTLKKKNRK